MSAAKSEHSGHRQRMKNKFLNHGIDTLEQHEILEILLYYAIPMKDTNPIAHKLINKFGSLSAVLDAPYEVLTETGLSENTAFLMKFLPEFLSVYMDDKFNNDNKIITMDNLPQKFINKFLGKTTEMAYLLLMDSRFKELYCGIVSKGSLTSTDLNIPRICELAIRYAARYAIVAHNHPSGSSLPSQADIIATINLYQALQPLKVSLLDHFLVADNDCISFYDANVFFKTKEEFQQSDFFKSSLFS